MSKAFKNSGYEVLVADNAAMALRHAASRLPHILLSEVMLPDMDGIELCKLLRKDPLTSGMIILFSTVRSEDYSQVAAFAAGADDYIVKPAKLNLLLPRMQALIRRVVSISTHPQA